MGSLHSALTGRRPERSDLDRRWRVWDLDAELRYAPVVRALPALPLPICEVGSGPRGIAAWTSRDVIGVDPGDDERHGSEGRPAENMRRLQGDGANIPLEDASVSAAVAVDTMEHVPREHRAAVVTEMLRVTAPGGRVILMGPAGPDAAEGDRALLERFRERGDTEGPVVWLSEHLDLGLPTVDELVDMVDGERVRRVEARGVFNMSLWWTMHRAALGEFPQPRGAHHVHHLLWAPFGEVARRFRRGPFYRQLVLAEVV